MGKNGLNSPGSRFFRGTGRGAVGRSSQLYAGEPPTGIRKFSSPGAGRDEGPLLDLMNLPGGFEHTGMTDRLKREILRAPEGMNLDDESARAAIIEVCGKLRIGVVAVVRGAQDVPVGIYCGDGSRFTDLEADDLVPDSVTS